VGSQNTGVPTGAIAAFSAADKHLPDEDAAPRARAAGAGMASSEARSNMGNVADVGIWQLRWHFAAFDLQEGVTRALPAGQSKTI
jgi:hypothetical protein